MALTFLIVCLAWVFFRADDLPAATRYLASLFNLGGAANANSLLLRAIFYEPGHVMVMLVAAAIAFFGVQAWDLSRNVTPLRASWPWASWPGRSWP